MLNKEKIKEEFREFMNEQNKNNQTKSFRSFLRESGPKEYDLDRIIEEDEIIREMAVAGYGDWKPSKDMVASMSTFILDKKWKYIDEQKHGHLIYRIYKQNATYIAGYYIENEQGETKFEVDFEIKLSADDETKHIFKISKQLMNVDKVLVQETTQGRGIATMMYKFLVMHEGFVILGDEIQFFGARRLWAKLSREIDVRVDIIDLHSEKVLEKDVILKHGTEDWDFDKRVWSYDFDKKYIRLILKEIK